MSFQGFIDHGPVEGFGLAVAARDHDMIAERAPERGPGGLWCRTVRAAHDPAAGVAPDHEAAVCRDARDGPRQRLRQQAVMEQGEGVMRARGAGVCGKVRAHQQGCGSPVQVELVARAGQARRALHRITRPVQQPDRAERCVEHGLVCRAGEGERERLAAGCGEVAFEGVECGLRRARCRGRVIGWGRGLRRNGGCEAKAGDESGRGGAKRLARGAEWAYVTGNTGSGDTMAEAAFNTIAEIQRLRDAGLPQEQAEAITLSIHSGVTGGVATKSDLDLVRKDIELVHKDIDLVRKDVQALDAKIDTSVKALDAKIDTGLAALDTKIDLVKEGLETKIDASVKMLETKMEKQTAQLGEQIANGFAEVAERQVVQMRWMIASIIGSIGVLVAAYAAFQ